MIDRTSSPAIQGSRLPLLGLFASATVSEIGDVLAEVAIPWFVLITTGSAARTGVTAAVIMLARILAGLFGGTLIDRLGHKRASITADLLSGSAIATIPLLYHRVGLSFPLLLILVFLAALLNTPGITARQSLLPGLAQHAGLGLERANAIFIGISRVADVSAPLVAGVLIVVVGTSSLLWLDALSFLLSALIISFFVPMSPSPRMLPTTRRRYLTQLRESMQFIRGDRLVLNALVVIAFTRFVIDTLIVVIVPVYAKQIYGRPAYLGAMLSAFGGGALASVTLYGMLHARRSRRTILISAFVVTLVPLVGLVTIPPITMTVALLIVLGVGVGPMMPVLMTVFQERTPVSMRGRVFGLTTAVMQSTIPLGMLLAGTTLETIGMRQTLGGAAGLFLLITLGVIVNPTFRSSLDSERQTHPQTPVGEVRANDAC